MFVIQIADVINILDTYSCNVNVIAIEMLSYFQEQGKVCMVISATINENKKYVIKVLNSESTDIILEEKRSAFSEFLRLSGLSVPKKYTCNGSYCTIMRISEIEFLITVEDYFGEDVKEINTSSAFMLGSMLGKMHCISYNADYHLKKGYVYSALKSGRTNHVFIWRNLDALVFDSSNNRKLKSLHNNKIRKLQELWDELPIAAVHGDLGLTSNLMYRKKQYGIIDFNLSGDEVLLGDLLITWYSSRYSNDFIRKVAVDSIESIKEAFFCGYYSIREMLDIEKHYFDKLSKILNGIYFNKFVANLIKEGNIDLGIKLSKKICEHYFISDTPIDLGGELKP